jgi:hypothetical protein
MAAERLSEDQYQLRIEQLAELVSDYRLGEIPPRTAKIIELWMKQFPASERHPLLRSLLRILKRTYISRERLLGFFKRTVSCYNGIDSQEISSKDFWRNANLLDIQKAGESQKEMHKIMDEALIEVHGFGLSETGQGDSDFVYVDDLVATGSRVRNDIRPWLKTVDASTIKLHLVAPVQFTGSWWMEKQLKDSAEASGKSLQVITRWPQDTDGRPMVFENRRTYKDVSDVLWPTIIPDDDVVQDYVKNLKYPVVLRDPVKPDETSSLRDSDKLELFRGLEAERMILESQMLASGCRIRKESNNLPERACPLGYENLGGLGFGSMFVTFRNCPNNSPISLWAGSNDIPPLFPRKSNAQTERQHE